MERFTVSKFLITFKGQPPCSQHLSAEGQQVNGHCRVLPTRGPVESSAQAQVSFPVSFFYEGIVTADSIVLLEMRVWKKMGFKLRIFEVRSDHTVNGPAFTNLLLGPQ